MSTKTNILARLDLYVVMLKNYVLSLRDVRNLGLLVFTVIVLLITWSGVKSIQANYGLQKQIAQLQQENNVQSLANSDLDLQNKYLDTDQYLEVTARANLGLGTPGETELLIPREVALSHTVDPPSDKTAISAVPQHSFWQRNFQAWISFFLHRQSTTD